MKNKNSFWNWLIKNFSNIFSVIGILLTIYFGVIYVPAWVKEVQDEKIRNAEESIQQSIKELIFNDSLATFSEIQAIVSAKQLELKQELPHSIKDYLTLVQNSFMEDKFIPINKRKELIEEIEDLKNNLPPEFITQTIESKNDTFSITVDVISIALSLLLAGLGIFSAYLKHKNEKEKDEEINNYIDQSFYIKNIYSLANEIEKNFKEIILNISGIKLIQSDENFDIAFNYNNKDYFVEIKFLVAGKIGVNVINRFLNILKNKKGIAWFMHNSELTSLAQNEVEKFNKENSSIKLVIIKFTEKDELFDLIEKQLKEIST